MPTFRVGQVVYLIPKGERRVIPAQVTEEIFRRTIGGEETVWMIQLAGSTKSVPIDPEVGEYYTSEHELRDELIQRTTKQVNAMLDKTIALANEAFGQDPVEVEPESTIDVIAPVSSIILPDGTRAKLRTA